MDFVVVFGFGEDILGGVVKGGGVFVLGGVFVVGDFEVGDGFVGNGLDFLGDGLFVLVLFVVFWVWGFFGCEVDWYNDWCGCFGVYGLLFLVLRLVSIFIFWDVGFIL